MRPPDKVGRRPATDAATNTDNTTTDRTKAGSRVQSTAQPPTGNTPRLVDSRKDGYPSDRARVHPNQAMTAVLRRVRAYGLAIEQVHGGPVWVTGCPAHDGTRTGLTVRWDQRDDGTVGVHPHRRDGQIRCTPAEILAALNLADPRVMAYDVVVRHTLARPERARWYGVAETSEDIYDRLVRALEDGGYAGRRSHAGRYNCPACGGDGATGRGIKVTYQPHAIGRHAILIVCHGNRCPLPEILAPLGMTAAELCAADDVDRWVSA